MATVVETTPRIGLRPASRYLDELARRVLVFDSAMGTSIHAHGLGPTDPDHTGIRSQP